MVVVANKWDLIPSEERTARFEEIAERVSVFPSVPVIRTSAKTGLGIRRLPPVLLQTHDAWSKRLSTSEVNRVVQRAQVEVAPPRQTGRILYASQVASGPPRFVLFSGGPIPTHYSRYLENRIRAAFKLEGVPIRFTFRRRRKRR
jgi:GTP-binding protein